MDGSDDLEQVSRIPTLEDLVTLCRHLNTHEAKYVIIGGFAIIRFGYIRATGDINGNTIARAIKYGEDRVVRFPLRLPKYFRQDRQD